MSPLALWPSKMRSCTHSYEMISPYLEVCVAYCTINSRLSRLARDALTDDFKVHRNAAKYAQISKRSRFPGVKRTTRECARQKGTVDSTARLQEKS